MAALETVNTLQTREAVEGHIGLAAAPPAESNGKGTGNILIVDPAAARRWHLLQTLSGAVGTVREANTTSEGLAILARNPIDLVLLDLRAPEIGAANFCREVRNMSAMKFMKIFVLAESDSLEAEVQAIEAGANEFLVSPVRDRALRARVQSNLRHKAMVDSLDDSEAVLFSLAKSVEDRDPDLSLHCQRLSIMVAAMGVALQLPAHDILTLQRGGYLHDIGKISIPDRVLFKPGPLTPDEWEIMKSHTVRGEKICAGIKSLEPVLPIIRSHHERWDGLGYPDGQRGEQIPLLARILQLADIYDALTTVRPYKPAYSPEDALSIIMEETGKGWRDPHLVRVFADILPMFRSPSLADLSRLSLHALAHSVESFRKDSTPVRPKKGESSQIHLVG
jgi:putative two-component system response regulator